jgi:hypothetical protein
MDEYAEENYLSRSGLVTIAVTQYLNQMQVISAVKEMSLAMRKIADKGNVDEVTMEQLEDFERISKMLIGVK